MTNEEAMRIATGLRIDFKCESETMVDFCNTIIKALKQKSVLDKAYELGKAEQPKMGRWIPRSHVFGVAYCSECDFELKIDDTNYCPNCGAKMEEEQDAH